MTKQLYLIGAKPNPRGREELHGKPLLEALLGEFTDIQNKGTSDVSTEDVILQDTTFDHKGHPNPKPVTYWKGRRDIVIPAGKILRVHGGHEADAAKMRPEDRAGADVHAYREKDTFVLNDKEGDHLYVDIESTNGLIHVDDASYRPHPPKGQRLVRKGDLLVPVDAGEASQGGVHIPPSRKPIAGAPGRFA
jgi:hypothetical protein